MDIEHLREFAYLAETLSFSTTARHFFMSTSVLSKHIASLEKSLQVKLFERDRRHVELTKAGHTFYGDVGAVLANYDRALENLESSRGTAMLHLRIGYLRGAARPFLPMFVQHMEQNYPNVSIDLVCLEYGELVRAHRSHQFDFVLNIDIDPENEQFCESQPIYQDRLYIIVSRNHRLANHAEGVTVADLEGERLILPDGQTYPGLAQYYEQILQEAHDPVTALRYKDIDTLYFRIAQGNCIGFSSGHNYRQFEGRAAFLQLNDVDTSYNVSAQWLKGTNPVIVDIARSAAQACAEYTATWTDGIAG